MKRAGSAVLAAMSLASCRHEAVIELPRPVALDALHAGARRAADLSKVKVDALYVVPKSIGLSAEARDVALLELVAALGDDGALYINDVIHDDVPAAYGFGKIARNSIALGSAQGVFRGEQLLYTPSEDVLVSLDRGYEISVVLGERQERVVFRPLYDANVYAPYARAGSMPAPAAEGESPRGAWSDADFDGENGKSGASGKNGGRGKDGKNAKARGQDGGHGGNGAAGENGDTGERGGEGGGGGHGGDGAGGASGGDGMRGEEAEVGPMLMLDVRPIYSKFYPDEELIFIEVNATYASGRGEQKRYILHRGQKFSIASIGGRGGQGGAGGRGGEGGGGGGGGEGGDGGKGGDGRDAPGEVGGDGGDGGNGGTGGNGGDGASGGEGGDGASGGQGGDGGEIRARVVGDEAFQRAVRESLVLRSIGGEGGEGGERGYGGNAGDSGSPGAHGSAGNGGDGGSGKTYGRSGQKGSDGKDGERGKSGESAGSAGKNGDQGRRGASRRTAW